MRKTLNTITENEAIFPFNVQFNSVSHERLSVAWVDSAEMKRVLALIIII